jgi:hypothetical protein
LAAIAVGAASVGPYRERAVGTGVGRGSRR